MPRNQAGKLQRFLLLGLLENGKEGDVKRHYHTNH